MQKVLVCSLLLVLGYPLCIGAVNLDPKFSLDPASPALVGNLTPDDVLKTGPVIHTPGSALGLQDNFPAGAFDNLDALSYGRDPIRNPLFFSVDRVAVGLPGSAVHAEAQPGVASAAGDIYTALPPIGSNQLVLQEQQLGLTPGFFGDDVDALELDTEPAPFTYFSVDLPSATNGFGVGTLANDILISTGNGSFAIFALGEVHMDLAPLDDLDALVLQDVFQPGVLNPGIDQALFSLSTFSPSTFTSSGNPYVPGAKGFLSPADILSTDFTGSFSLWAAATDLGLRPDDEVDALDTVPEPATVLLMASGVLGLLGYRYRARSKRR